MEANTNKQLLGSRMTDIQKDFRSIGGHIAKTLRPILKKELADKDMGNCLHTSNEVVLKLQYDMPDDLIDVSLRVGGLVVRYVDMYETEGNEMYCHDYDDFREDKLHNGFEGFDGFEDNEEDET